MHLRPMLTIKKRELTRALRAAGAEWCEDATNADGDFYRNRVRRSVLPAWARAAGRDALAGAALARDLLEEDDAALEARVEEIGALTDDGTLSKDIMPDLLHPNEKGYEIWARAMEPELQRLMK